MSHLTDNQPPERTVYQVHELNAMVRELLEGSFPLLWIEGELSNLARPRSGHWYFTLKDEQSQVRCAMFRSANRVLGFVPEDGQQLLVRARVGLYAARGEYQLVVQHMETAGDGALRRAFEQLKRKLADAGLFDDAHKRTLPAVPRRIGVITSATGAAWRDVQSVLQRRFPLGEVLLYPVMVQGAAAAPAIVRALQSASARGDCDVLLLVRGGGSLEDLWAFNEEAVARAIRACPIPVVTGVGHETDFTIADFAADLRAPTPSVAAERACPDQTQWAHQIAQSAQRAAQAIRRRLTAAEREHATLAGRLRRLHPQRQLQQRMQRLDELENRLQRSARQRLEGSRAHCELLTTRLRARDPRIAIKTLSARQEHLRERLQTAMNQRLERNNARLRLAANGLHTISPLRTLERGYAIAQAADGAVLTDARSVHAGDRIDLRLHCGALQTQVVGRLTPKKHN